jgi:hypothetical protein
VDKRIDGVEFTEQAFKRIVACAKDEHISPEQWLGRVGEDISRRIFRLKEWEEQGKPK